MSKRESLLRYSAIINKLRRSPATLKEIVTYLENESEIQAYNLRTSQRTFQRDLEDIRSLYGLDIQYDFSKKKYHIENSANEALSDRMLEAFDTYNILRLSGGLHNFLDFEERKSGGLEYFHGLLHAIKNQLQINLKYRSFGQNSPSERKIHPYLLKEFKNRWYLIAKDLRDERIKTYALDRIFETEITRKKYINPVGYNPKEQFKHSFGIISSVDGSIPERVVLSFNRDQGRYVETLPLHHSQRILSESASELRIELTVYIAVDFIKELLSFGPDVKVIEPKELADKLKAMHQLAFEQY